MMFFGGGGGGGILLFTIISLSSGQSNQSGVATAEDFQQNLAFSHAVRV